MKKVNKEKDIFTENELSEMQKSLEIFSSFSDQYVLPIYQKIGSLKPELRGSGFVVEVNGNYFFITAAHVFDHHSVEHPLFFHLDQKHRLELNGAATTSLSRMHGRTDDQIDVAVVSLPARISFGDDIDKSVIRQNQISAESSVTLDCRYIVSGYPLTKYKPDNQLKLLNPLSYTWIGKTVPEVSYLRLSIKRTQNLLIQFSRKHVKCSTGLKGGMFPEPRGISGGPVWQAVGYRNQRGLLVVDDILLIGVVIEQVTSEKALLVTNIDVVMSMINDLSTS